MSKNESDKIFEKGSTTFYNSSRFFFGQIKKDVSTLYAFVRTADDFVDRVPQDSEGFYKFKNTYLEALNREIVTSKVINDFIELKNRKKFPNSWVEAFLGAMETDIVKKHYETEDEVQEYIFGSAGVIGLMMANIFELPEESHKYAEKLGTAYQYINFIRDIREDMGLERNYFPKTDQEQFGITEYTIDYLSRNSEKFKSFVKYQIQKYKKYLHEGIEGFKFIPKQYRISIQTANDMYNWTADVIDKDPLVVLSKSVKPTKAQVLLSGFKNLFIA